MAGRSVADAMSAVQRALAGPPAVLRLAGLRGSSPAYALAQLLATERRPVVALLPDAAAAETFVAELRFYLGETAATTPLTRRIHLLPAWDVPPFEPLSPSREVLAARAEGLYHLLETPDPVLVTTPDGWGQRCMARETFRAAVSYLVAGEPINRDELAERLIDWGYHRVPLVQDPGELAVRGGIVDVFPAGYARPVRFELLGDEIEHLRSFDPSTQRSEGELEDVLLLPVREFSRASLSAASARRVEERAEELGVARGERRELVEAIRAGLVVPGLDHLLPYLHDRLDVLADHLPPHTLIWLQGAADVEASAERWWARLDEFAEAAARAGRVFAPPQALYVTGTAWRATLEGRRRVEVEALDAADHDTIRAASYTVDLGAARAAAERERPLAPVAAQLAAWGEEGTRLVVVASGPAHRDRLAGLLASHGVAVTPSDLPFPEALATPGRGPLGLVGDLTRGMRGPADGLVVVTESELLGDERPRRRARRERLDDLLSSLAELKPDDFVVHVDHGVAIYRGLRHMQVAGLEGDYLHLEYQGGDRLYVPVDRIGAVQRYVGADGAAPPLDKLGGATWERTKAKTRESLMAMAHELLKIYAAREAHGRAAYGRPDTLYDEFVARFPFEETPDQLRAIDDVLADLGRDRPMDRLVCGDVGFGKTEVAMRAAFLAVLAGKQVAVLVPTTLLAQQHYETFRARFAGYPIEVGLLSRFRTGAENKETIARLAAGRLDVVVGTHRLLQKDVAFRNLGLLVVDEEHRFGVKDKERIRALRTSVDVLTLTATPIPRTLNMAISGIRDLSVITTPPVDRLAIRTYVARYDEGLIRDAVLRELARGGQVFFVHNRVESIDRMAARLAEVVPEARLAVAHGQMSESALERTMLRFMHGEADVLVTSAIIESGLDIPNANTLIVNRADTFGLAQLYQLRGRVGRSHHRAYAYLLIPGEHLITSDAQKRLQVLQELDDLGGGFRLAAHDLEIRGAGNLLGKQQSGNIAAIGLELYTQMMEQAVREARGEAPEPEVEPEIQLGIAAFIPESYLPDVGQRLLVYKRLAAVRSTAELDAVAEELVDRFGPVPPLVVTLLRVMDLRRLLKELRVRTAKRRGGTIQVEFDPGTPLGVDRLLEGIRGSGGRLRLVNGTTLEIRPLATDPDELLEEVGTVLRKLNAP
ncbi:MAG TPA: transcription-repair coupling factor [Candidatus Limnocylindria bacterium]|nr:transcription-repair coupling factor [Candidatus Limnocylindria bacterium]